MAKQKHYILTKTAAQDFRQAKTWSKSRWGADLTRQYFQDLHKGAEYIAKNFQSLQNNEHLSGDTNLSVYAIREHYIVYVPKSSGEIIIVALIRQTRDVPNILKVNDFVFQRELKMLE